LKERISDENELAAITSGVATLIAVPVGASLIHG
jgi:hypothetical protein